MSRPDPPMRPLSLDERKVLAALDYDVWSVLGEVAVGIRLSRSRTVGKLRALRHLGLVSYRISDVPGHPGEWARTERGTAVVASWTGSEWVEVRPR